MNIKSLRIFVNIIEDGTLARAAERLNLSPPAASRLLGLLEEELGVPLFLRVKKRLISTPQADSLYHEAIRILASVDGIPSFVRQIQQGKSDPLRIVCLSRLTSGLVLPSIIRLLQKRPDVRTSFEVYHRSDLERRFAWDIYDVGVGSLPAPVRNIESDHLYSTSFYVMLSKNHPLAKKSKLTAKDLADLPYIALNRQTLLRKIIDENLDHSGAKLDPRHEVSTTAAAYKLVCANLGFAIVDPIAIDEELRDAVSLIPWHPKAMIDFGIFRKKSDNPHNAAEDFIDCLRATCREVFHIYT